MPYVKIQVTDEGVSAEQKAMLIHETTDMLSRVLDKDPATTFVVIEEVSMDNWGVAGLPVTQYRQQHNQSSIGE